MVKIWLRYAYIFTSYWGPKHSTATPTNVRAKYGTLQLAEQSPASLLACSACPTHERLLMVTLSMIILFSLSYNQVNSARPSVSLLAQHTCLIPARATHMLPGVLAHSRYCAPEPLDKICARLDVDWSCQ